MLESFSELESYTKLANIKWMKNLKRKKLFVQLKIASNQLFAAYTFVSMLVQANEKSFDKDFYELFGYFIAETIHANLTNELFNLKL